MEKRKVAVFLLFGQSNAVGHNVPMDEDDKIIKPLKNVFGLHRNENQSFDNSELFWSGYTSGGMNLAEEQDDTYSVANCLAKDWQNEIDNGRNLPDLYIVQIAIGAQGISEGQMWNPEYEKMLIPGKLGTVKISLYPYTLHILSIMQKSFDDLGVAPDYVGLHWRGGEQDWRCEKEYLETRLKGLYEEIFEGFYSAIGNKIPARLHRFIAKDYCIEHDSTGKMLENMHYINSVFEDLCEEHSNISVFDVSKAPFYVENIRGNGMFIDDVAHFTPDTNKWVAEEILKEYTTRTEKMGDFI